MGACVHLVLAHVVYSGRELGDTWRLEQGPHGEVTTSRPGLEASLVPVLAPVFQMGLLFGTSHSFQIRILLSQY